ncbi:MAG: VOC family protein [Lysobacteraceae bacterium]
MRLLHTMLRVVDLERSLAFYVDARGMTLFRREDYPTGGFILAFVGYGSEATSAAIELTWNRNATACVRGDAYGHVAIGVADVHATCAALAAKGVRIVRPAGPMAHRSPDRDDVEVIAFIEDPDGYRIELIGTAA